MLRRLAFSLIALLLAGCLPATATPAPVTTVPPTAAPPTAVPSPTLEPASPTPTEPAPTSAPSATPPAEPAQFLAYVRAGQLLVTEVTGGVQGGTTQYTLAGADDQVADLAWSPSGEFIAYTSVAHGEPRLFVVYAVGAGTPVDLGPGLNPAWSPDSAQLAFERDGNLWVAPSDGGGPARQLTFQANWAWGRPAFTPDGRALLVAETSRDFMGAQGNTSFTLKTLALDGTGALAALPLAEPFEGGRLPYDLRYAPAGGQIGFTTSYHVNACASGGALYVQGADGGGEHELVSPSLAALSRPGAEIYHTAYSYAWSPAGEAVAVSAAVRDCTDFAGTLLGAQLSVLGLDGAERLVIPGLLLNLSYDRAGRFIAATYYADWQNSAGRVHIYSAAEGQLALDLGDGSLPQFQP